MQNTKQTVISHHLVVEQNKNVTCLKKKERFFIITINFLILKDYIVRSLINKLYFIDDEYYYLFNLFFNIYT